MQNVEMSHQGQVHPHHGGANPQTQQPEIWMPKPTVSASAQVPPGLEYLTMVDQLLVKQKIELFEMVSGIETENRYVVKNTMGQTVFKAKEDSGYCARQCCGANRPFKIRIFDNLNQKVITIRRNYHCVFLGQCLSCSKCCQDEIEVKCAKQVVGYVKQLYEGCDVRYSICNPSGEPVLRIHGPNYCALGCWCRKKVPFHVMSADGQVEVGRITKEWTNLAQEWFTDADNFGVQFPVDLDVRVKATVLAAVFLIDFMYYEDSDNNRNQHHYY